MRFGVAVLLAALAMPGRARAVDGYGDAARPLFALSVTETVADRSFGGIRILTERVNGKPRAWLVADRARCQMMRGDPAALITFIQKARRTLDGKTDARTGPHYINRPGIARPSTAHTATGHVSDGVFHVSFALSVECFGSAGCVWGFGLVYAGDLVEMAAALADVDRFLAEK